ncbi:unnamed protein product [Rotaria socialis]|uniref:Uncharacterized protein n=1 Tax=Rotaria socialis TaxID=392032 RepID=A0A821DVB6_9BILA|nr:unnamed protein product [Rotaria socialis]CAF4627248.1 unnamed protein product [Rotaria socialis]
MASPPTQTITQVTDRCRAIVLKLKSPTTDSRQTESAQMVAGVQRRVDAIFDQLLNRYVYHEQERINQDLLARLKKSKDPDAFLEVFLIELYQEAIREEKESLKGQISEQERREMDNLSRKASDAKQKMGKNVMQADSANPHKESSV